jgi:hypothetical protein
MAWAPTGATSCPSRRSWICLDVGPVRFVFPNAPEMPVTINGGYVMPAWYDILGADLTAREDEQRPACIAGRHRGAAGA